MEKYIYIRSKPESVELAKYGRIRERYLKEHRRAIYGRMRSTAHSNARTSSSALITAVMPSEGLTKSPRFTRATRRRS